MYQNYSLVSNLAPKPLNNEHDITQYLNTEVLPLEFKCNQDFHTKIIPDYRLINHEFDQKRLVVSSNSLLLSKSKYDNFGQRPCYFSGILENISSKKGLKGNVVLRKKYENLKLTVVSGSLEKKAVLMIYGQNHQSHHLYEMFGPFQLTNSTEFRYSMDFTENRGEMKNGKALQLVFKVTINNFEICQEITPFLYVYERQKYETMSRKETLLPFSNNLLKI